MTQPDLLAAVSPVVDALERLDIPYSIVGSIASSVHGVARASIDADLVVDLKSEHVEPLAALLEEAYYIEPEAAARAVERRSQFNVVHLATVATAEDTVLHKLEWYQDQSGSSASTSLSTASRVSGSES